MDNDLFQFNLEDTDIHCKVPYNENLKTKDIKKLHEQIIKYNFSTNFIKFHF